MVTKKFSSLYIIYSIRNILHMSTGLFPIFCYIHSNAHLFINTSWWTGSIISLGLIPINNITD